MTEFPKRKNIRLKDFDYSQNGYYFIMGTVSTQTDVSVINNKSKRFIVL